MKMFIPLLCLLSFTIAEPPVGDSYASAISSHGYNDNDFQRSLTDEYGPPPKNSLTSEYGPPKARSSHTLSSTYGSPNSRISEEYGVPNTRGISKISQKYNPSSARNVPSQEYSIPGARNTPSLDYGVPAVHKAPSNIYGVPSTASLQKYGSQKSRNIPSQEYGTPKNRKTPSEVYGVPSTRNSPSQEYGVPATRSSAQEYGVPKPRQSSSHLLRNFESANPSNIYGAPRKPIEEYGPEYISKSQPTNLYLSQKSSPLEYNDVSSRNNFKPKSFSKSSDSLTTYGAPKIDSLSYEIPNLSSDYSQGFNDFGTKVSDTFKGKSRASSQKYGAPRAADLNTNAVASSYSYPRSSPSSAYGVPANRDTAPSEVYGVPEQYNDRSSQGYEYAKAGDEDIQEPANYEFAYKVNDYITGSDFGHSESRQENRAEGTYFVVLPDGNKQVVEYEADERGFKPRITVEPADTLSGGYDDNAADLTDSSDGPY